MARVTVEDCVLKIPNRFELVMFSAQRARNISAGAAITLAIVSLLTGVPVNNKVALTGEIDLMKNVTAIGGVYAKLNGAKEAGVKKALIPKENLDDLNILRDKGISPEDDTFTVETIKTIEDVMKHCIV